MKSQKAPTPPFTSLLNQAVFVPFCLTAVLALILLWQMENVKTSGTWVHHTEEVTSKIGSVKEHLLDSETGLRGFALTHAAEFLEPYNKAFPELNMSLVQLDGLDPIWWTPPKYRRVPKWEAERGGSFRRSLKLRP